MNNIKINFYTTLTLIFLFSLNSCKIDELNFEPEIKPEQWCKTRPCFEINDIIFSEPIGSILVFTLSLLWIIFGLNVLKNKNHQKSKLWLGIALVLGGLGVFFAGLSHQAFSYTLKCQHFEFCKLTNSLEISYSLLQNFSVCAMLVAIAFSSTKGIFKRGIFIYSFLNGLIYLTLILIGITIPNKFLLSFEILLLFAFPSILIVFINSSIRYVKFNQSIDKSILYAMVFLVVINFLYFIYLKAEICKVLYKNGEGIYFSENDVLHLGMIFWIIYLVKSVGNNLKDLNSIK